MTAELLLRATAQVGESPLWDDRTGELVWIDMPTGELHRVDPGTGVDRVRLVGGALGAVAVRAAGGFVAAYPDGFGLIGSGPLEPLAAVLPEPELRMNDAKCDPAGRFWAGSTEVGFAPGRGALRCLHSDGRVDAVWAGLVLPNGLGWSPDGRTFYLADSVARVVYRADFDPAAGRLGDRVPWLSPGWGEAMPDGLCVDDEGCVWLALWGGSEVRRYAPSGRLVGTVALPVSQAASCVLGPGPTLYVTTARAGLSAAALAAEPLAGSVFAVPAPAAATPLGSYAG